MLKILAWIELATALILLTLTYWPLTTYCAGRPGGLDCESRFIFGVNMFAPIGVLAFVCAAWSLRRNSLRAQWVLLAGTTLVFSYFLIHAVRW